MRPVILFALLTTSAAASKTGLCYSWQTFIGVATFNDFGKGPPTVAQSLITPHFSHLPQLLSSVDELNNIGG